MVVPHWEKDASAKFFPLRQGDQFCYDDPSPGEFIQVDWILGLDKQILLGFELNCIHIIPVRVL